MSVVVMPSEPAKDELLDPERILAELPAAERGTFLAAYQRAVDGAREPAGWKALCRLLRLWSWRAIAISAPGFYEGQAAARDRAGGGMLLSDAIRQRRGCRS